MIMIKKIFIDALTNNNVINEFVNNGYVWIGLLDFDNSTLDIENDYYITFEIYKQNKTNNQLAKYKISKNDFEKMIERLEKVKDIKKQSSTWSNNNYFYYLINLELINDLANL